MLYEVITLVWVLRSLWAAGVTFALINLAKSILRASKPAWTGEEDSHAAHHSYNFV